MITELHIRGLRGVLDGGIEGMGPLVVLVGPNGCGKSTILDALLIGAGNNPGDAIGRCVLRRPYSWNGSRWLFHRAQEEPTATIGVTRVLKGRVEQRSTLLQWMDMPRPELAQGLSRYQRPEPYSGISARIIQGERESLAQVAVAGNNAYQVAPIEGEPIRGWEMRLIDSPQGANQSLDEVYSRAVESGRKDLAVAAVEAILGDGFRDITILTEHRVPVVHVVFADGSVPVSAAGEGVASLVRIALELVGRPRGTVLLEEPEAHQHPRIIWQAAEIIWATVQRDVQVILSTHSMELLDALIAKAPDGALDKMAVFRVKLEDGRLGCARIGGEDVASMRCDFEDDLR